MIQIFKMWSISYYSKTGKNGGVRSTIGIFGQGLRSTSKPNHLRMYQILKKKFKVTDSEFRRTLMIKKITVYIVKFFFGGGFFGNFKWGKIDRFGGVTFIQNFFNTT